MGSVGPDDINPLEHDIATPDKQLGAVSGGSGGPHSGPGTPWSDRFSGGWRGLVQQIAGKAVAVVMSPLGG
jgi:hypothetical protein